MSYGAVKFSNEDKWHDIEYRKTVDGLLIIRPDDSITYLNGVEGATTQVKLDTGEEVEARIGRNGHLLFKLPG